MAIADWLAPPEWKPVSRGALIAWLVFYALFLLHMATFDEVPFTHPVNLVVHEGGHFFFFWFGDTIGLLGGTIAEVLVPLLFAVYFYRQGHAAGVAFCLFWTFHTSQAIGIYMADARTVTLPLVGGGEHDWELLFGRWGLLLHDRSIGFTVRFLGWVGMIGTVIWFVLFSWRHHRDSPLLDSKLS